MPQGREPATAYPLTWPEHRQRTPLNLRERNWIFWRGTLDKHRQSLLSEIRKLGGADVIISSDMPLRKDGQILGNAREPDDSGVAVYFNYKKKPMCFACDKYGTVRENIRAIALTIEAIRGIERWGSSDMMEQAFRGFTALPEKAGEYWRDILGFSPDDKVTPDLVEVAFKRLAHVAHPDKGGNVEQFNMLVVARENARKDLGVTR